MELVRAGFRDHIDVNAQIGAILRRVRARLNLHLLNGLHHHARGCVGDEIIHHADPVQRKAVLDFPRPGADEVRAWRRRRVGGFGPQDYTRCSNGEPHRIAAAQRQIETERVLMLSDTLARRS